MKSFKYLLIFFVLLIAGSLQERASAYVFGLKSANNTISNIQQIEDAYMLYTPIVAFIFDPRSEDVTKTLDTLPSTLGLERIYHITISPNSLSATDVAEGKFDAQYTKFFQKVKENNLKVVFRTMHEMNGGRYPRASNPTAFKKARIHVWDLSRALGLDNKNILFDFSINHRDMPTKGTPSQTAKLIQCNQNTMYETEDKGKSTKVKGEKTITKKITTKKSSTPKKKICYTFEDYYPGAAYVDVMGVTFYNRGKGNSDRAWLTPSQILYASARNTLGRLKSFNKPIFVDEVATTAVYYTGDFNYKKTVEVYKTNYNYKNKWLKQLKDFFIAEPEIVGFAYFNVDYTNGLKTRLIGEADRSVLDFASNRMYNGIFDLYKGAEHPEQNNSLLALFGEKIVQGSGTSVRVSSKLYTSVKDAYAMFASTTGTNKDRIAQIERLKTNTIFLKKYKRFSSEEINDIVEATKKLFTE